MLQRQKTTIESEFQRAEERIHRSNEEKADLQERFTELKAKAAVEEKNFNLLKETCSVMDDQLKVFSFYGYELVMTLPPNIYLFFYHDSCISIPFLR